MRISEITRRHRNDFSFIAECNCGETSRWGDGYADAFYQQRVFPDRCCPHCGLNEYGETEEAKEFRNKVIAAERRAMSAAQGTKP